MKKSEYIEKYGQESYEKMLKKQREYSAVYKTKNQDRVKASKNTYRQTHKEKIKECNRKYREKHKEDMKDYSKKYYDAHKEEFKAYMKDYSKKYYAKNYYANPRVRANFLLCGYRQMDKEANRECTLTTDWIVEKIFSGQSCIYCGETDWTKLGCDRIDNTKAHTPDNVVCACGACNVERRNKPFNLYKPGWQK